MSPAAMMRPQMPSIAPRGVAAMASHCGQSARAQTVAEQAGIPAVREVATPASLAPRAGVAAAHDDRASAVLNGAAMTGVKQTQRFEDAIRDFFNRQARMPPSTGTAFDPTMTPQWSSFKTLG